MIVADRYSQHGTREGHFQADAYSVYEVFYKPGRGLIDDIDRYTVILLRGVILYERGGRRATRRLGSIQKS